MSNNIIFGAIGFVIGGIVGGLFAGCWMGKEYKKTIDKMQYRIDTLKEELQENKKEDLEARERKVKVKGDAIIEHFGYSSTDKSEDEEDVDLEDDIDFDDPFTDVTEEKPTNGEETIRLIDKKTFDEDLPFRDSECLTFYLTDGILADEHDDPITNAADIIGIEAIEAAENMEFGKSDENGMLYVDNEIEDKLYEIVVERNETFYRDIER